MKRSRRILAGLILVVALAAAAGALVHHFSGRPPPHLVKRLPPADAMPPGLTAEQQAAIHRLYSLNPRDRESAIEEMREAKVPPEVQIPYLIALAADTIEVQEAHPMSPGEAWFWRIMGTHSTPANVDGESLSALGLIGPSASAAVLAALKAEEDVHIRHNLAEVLVGMVRNRPWGYAGRKGQPPPWRADPRVLDALADVFRTDTDQEVRLIAILGFLEALTEQRASAGGSTATPVARDDIGMLPEHATDLEPRHRDALVAAALENPDVDVRFHAMEGIARHFGPEAIPTLVRAADDPLESMRQHAVRMLASPGVLSYWMDGGRTGRNPSFLHPERPQVVRAMIDALQGEAARPTQRSPAIRSSLASALRWLTDQDFGDDAEKWQAWFETHQGDFSPR